MVRIIEVSSKERRIVVVGKEKCKHCSGEVGVHVRTVLER